MQIPCHASTMSFISETWTTMFCIGGLDPICHSSATFCHLSRIRKMGWTQRDKIPHWSTYVQQGQDGVQIQVDGSWCHSLCEIWLLFFESHVFDNSFQRWFQNVFVKLLINSNCFQKVQEKRVIYCFMSPQSAPSLGLHRLILELRSFPQYPLMVMIRKWQHSVSHLQF